MFAGSIIPSIFSTEVLTKNKNTDTISRRENYSRTTTDSVGGRSAVSAQGQKNIYWQITEEVVQ